MGEAWVGSRESYRGNCFCPGACENLPEDSTNLEGNVRPDSSNFFSKENCIFWPLGHIPCKSLLAEAGSSLKAPTS